MGGMLYVSPVVNDPNQAFVYALDASSGWQRWYRGLPESSSERLAVHSDALYVVMPNGGGLLALDRRLGVPAWRQPLEALPVSAPVALDDTVYLVASRTRLNPRVLEDFPDDATALPDPYPRSVVVVAMRAEDGTKRWEQSIGVEGAVTHAGEPVIGGAETIYVGANDGALYAFDATTGAPRWRYQTGGDQVSTPLIAGESAYVGASDGYVYALDAATGVLRWRAFTSTDVYGAASMRVGSLHIGGVKRKNDAE
jgi:serine/threonine-protein kinase